MPSYYEIPLSADPQTFSVQLVGVTYNLQLTYHTAKAGSVTGFIATDTSGNAIDLNDLSCWTMDISDANNNPLACGIPLIPGIDLLYQYQYLNIGGSLVVATEGDLDLVPTFDNLGSTSHLYFVVLP